MSFLLLFLDNAPILLDVAPTPCLHHSCFSYLKDLFTPHVLNWYFPPFMFFKVWEEQAFQIQLVFFKLNLKASIFFSNVYLLVIFVPCFDCPCFFGVILVIGFLFFMCKNYLDVVHIILHVAFHFNTLHFILHICILYFFKTMHLFSIFNFFL
jgi:hypothetical protein